MKKIYLLVLLSFFLLPSFVHAQQPAITSPTTIFFDDFDGTQLRDGWKIELLDGGGTAKVQNGTLALHTNYDIGGAHVIVFRNVSSSTKHIKWRFKIMNYENR